MKRQIRKNVFETNSSSLHSLVITKKDEHFTPEEISKDFFLHNDTKNNEKKCVWELYSDELQFGRSPFKVLNSFKDKWLYACASLVGEYNDSTYKELLALALKHVPNLKKITPSIEISFIVNKNHLYFIDDKYWQEHGKTEEELKEYLTQKEKDWGIETQYWETDNGYWHFYEPYTGEVDENILSGFLKIENITLEEYLTNKKYIVIQDGDEYCIYGNLKESGLINTDLIDHEYFGFDYEKYTEEE